MSTFFLKRGIRLPVGPPKDLSIQDLAVPAIPNETSTATNSSSNIPSSSPLLSRIETFLAEHGTLVVIRLADVDPFCQTQRAVTASMVNQPDAVKKAIELLCEKTGCATVCLAAHRGQQIGSLEQLAHQVIRIHARHYPLMSTPCLSKKQLPHRPVLMPDLHIKGVLAVDISELMSLVAPNDTHIVTVIEPSAVHRVRIPSGTTVAAVIETMFPNPRSFTVVAGTPFLGDIISDWSLPITFDALTLLKKDESEKPHNLPCCNCGKCVKVCVSHLLPGLLSKHVYVGNHDDARQLNVHACIECGCCAFMCPSKRPLVQYMRAGKQGASRP